MAARREDSSRNDDRRRRVTQILEEAARRRSSDESIDDDAVIAAHQELMPELGEKLHALRAVEAAQKRAEGPSTAQSALQVQSGLGLDSTVPESTSVPGTTNWPSDSREEVAIPRAVGNVKIEREIGRGGMGVVFRGWDDVLHRQVAVKFLLDAAIDKDDPHLEQFFSGARAEAAVRHPNIVTVYGAGLAKGIPWIVMDYIDGPTLRQLTRKVDRLPFAVAVKVMWDVAGALAALHERDLIHRDVKPSNVLFDQEGHLFVTDFGLASLRRRSDPPGSVAGTPAYMAPEAFDGKVSPQTDVYAMGIMFFELLAGRYPFATDGSGIRESHAATALPFDDLPDTVPAPLVELIDRAAHKKDLFRYKTAEHFRRALRSSVATDEVLRNGTTELKALLIGSPAKEADSAPAEDKPPSTTSTYFERLSELAIERRTTPTHAPRTDAIPRAGDGQIDDDRGDSLEDLLCIGCGYNLRGLSSEGRCPECGTPVHLSRCGDLLEVAEPAWLTRITRGETLVYAAFQTALASVILFFASVALMVLSMSWGLLPRSVDRFLLDGLYPGIRALAAFLLVLGIFGVTTLDPRLRLTEQPLVLRRFVRWAAMVPLSAVVASWLAFPLFRVLGMGSSLPDSGLSLLFRELPSGAHAVVRVAAPALTLLFVAGFLSTLIAALYYLARLAARIPNPPLATRTRSSARGLAVCSVLLALTIIVGVVVDPVELIALVLCAVFGLVGLGYTMSVARLLAAYRKEFRHCLSKAQGHDRAIRGV